MPITYTGRVVRPGLDEKVYPSLVDIAVGLSRQPRFAGQGRRWFSVLDHSLFADELMQRSQLVRDYDVSLRAYRLGALLHDGHEAITSDIPTDYKDTMMKMAQEDLDARILPMFIGNYRDPALQAAIKLIDRRALTAEARVIGPPVDPEMILHAFGITEDTHEDVQLLEALLMGNGLAANQWIGVPPTAYNPTEHPAVREFMSRMVALL